MKEGKNSVLYPLCVLGEFSEEGTLKIVREKMAAKKRKGLV